MANILPFEKQTIVVHALCEGNSIRSIERMTGINRNTIMNLGVRVGQACEKMAHEKMKNLDCRVIEIDEIWGFVGKKRKNVKQGDNPNEVGDVWTYIALDAETKLIPSFYVAPTRDHFHTTSFFYDLAPA